MPKLLSPDELNFSYCLSPETRGAGFSLEADEDGVNLMLKGALVARFGIHATIAEIERAAHQALCESQSGINRDAELAWDIGQEEHA